MEIIQPIALVVSTVVREVIIDILKLGAVDIVRLLVLEMFL